MSVCRIAELRLVRRVMKLPALPGNDNPTSLPRNLLPLLPRMR
jgi:hypothetical protein